MMMFRDNRADAVFDEIQSDLFTAMEQLGQAEADAWRERVAVPVEYVTGPSGHVYIIRSLPGEPPRRETGVMQESILSAVEADGHTLLLTIDSDINYAAFLHAGTRTIKRRPHAPDADELQARFVDAVIDAIEGK